MTIKQTIITLATAALCLASCQESLEDRAAREAEEYTKKNCPVRISDEITTDSLVFNKQTLTLHYYLSLSGRADTTAISETEIKKDMVSNLKGTTSIRPYKEAGYNFAYTFHSTKQKNKILYEVTITKNDYNN